MPLVPVLADDRAGRHPHRRPGAGGAVAATSSRSWRGYSARIFELAGEEFNVNSPKQLGEILFDKLKLPALKKTGKTRSASTAVEVLEELALTHELPRLILEWRGLHKLKGTYIDALPLLVHPETGRVHTCFNQAVAATGRLSSSDPNLQNIPIRTELGREIRRAFIAAPGHVLISADYSQIELRVLAHLAGEETLIEAFRAGEDIHDRTALKVFGADSGLDPHELRRPGEDHQLRAALRQDGVHPGQGHRRHAGGGAGVHRRVLRRLPAACAASSTATLRARARNRRRQDDVRPPAPGAGAEQPQRPDSRRRRTRRRSTCRSRGRRPTSSSGR